MVRNFHSKKLSSKVAHSGPAEADVLWFCSLQAMKAMKAMKAARAAPKSEIAAQLVDSVGLKKSEVMQVLDSLAGLATKELKKAGKFTLPGLVMIKTRKKKATKAGKKMMFGKEVKVKAQPAKTVVKAFPVKAVKDEF